MPLPIAPVEADLVTAHSSSSAAARGLAVRTTAKAEKRSGWPEPPHEPVIGAVRQAAGLGATACSRGSIAPGPRSMPAWAVH